MAYKYTLFSSIDSLDLAEWSAVLNGADAPYMDPRFIRAAERTLSDDADIRYVIIYDSLGRPVGVACLSTCRLNFEYLTAKRGRAAVRCLKRLVPAISNVKLTFCALPVATGDSSLHLLPDADADEVLRVLDRVMCEVAAREGSRWLYVGAFSPAECERLGPLETLGYSQLPALPMVYGATGFRSFDDYRAALKSHKRYTINRSRKKFDALGLRTVHVTGRDGGDRLYTDEVHRLFDSVADDKPRVANMPACFFREVSREMPDETVFTLIYQDDRVVAVAFSLCTPQSFNQLALGFDYALNPQCDLLFNLFYEIADYAFQQDTPRFVLGQTTDTFKLQKLGGIQESRHFFVKSLRGRFGTAVIKFCKNRMNSAPQENGAASVHRLSPSSPRRLLFSRPRSRSAQGS